MVVTTEGQNEMKKTILVIGLACAAITQSHARMGWTYDQCVAQWGAPVNNFMDKGTGQTSYTFQIQDGFFVQVELLSGNVATSLYLTRDKRFLINHSMEILQKEFPRKWTLSDDHRGKERHWNVFNENGDSLAYAVFLNNPNLAGWYRLQVSSEDWDGYLRELEKSPAGPATTSTVTGLNI
jgi:hypothetical protein